MVYKAFPRAAALVSVFVVLFAVGAFAPPANAGSICRDGTWSASEGRGTCSSHGGVAQSGVDDPGGRETIGPGTTGSSGTASSSGGGYSRDKFKHWVRQANGCTTREVVLIRQARGGKQIGCTIVGGVWFSVYDGGTTTNPSAFDVDHVVPLKEAWVSGANKWTPARREAFANDLGWTHSLIAVTASSNRSKSDRDPANWLPPNAKDRCRYVETWVGVKFRWKLKTDSAEKKAINQVLASCTINKKLTRPPRA